MMSDMRTPIIVGSDKATQYILAPTQNDLVAKQDYVKGALFIFNNGLYKTTAAITTGSNIIIGSGTGTNAEPSDKTVVEELKGINDPNLKLSLTPTVPTLSKGTNNTSSGYNTCYYKVGTKVCLSISISNLTAGQNNTVFTLPEGYRPQHTLYTVIAGASIGQSVNIIISVDGTVKLYTSSGTTWALGYIEFDAFN